LTGKFYDIGLKTILLFNIVKAFGYSTDLYKDGNMESEKLKI